MKKLVSMTIEEMILLGHASFIDSSWKKEY